MRAKWAKTTWLETTAQVIDASDATLSQKLCDKANVTRKHLPGFPETKGDNIVVCRDFICSPSAVNNASKLYVKLTLPEVRFIDVRVRVRLFDE